MSKRLFIIGGGLALSLTASAFTYGQSTATQTTAPSTTTVTTQTTTATQNSDGSWTVVEYPADKETIVNLTPSTTIPGAKGTAKILRHGDQTTINLDVAGLTGENNSYYLYSVDPMGKVSLLGPVSPNNGSGTVSFNTPMDKFMLFLSPEQNLTAMDANTKVLLRSAVPQGFAVVPMSSSGDRGNASVGERVKATTSGGATSAYNVPMLGIPSFRRGTDTHMKINFKGAMTGSRANVFIEPRKDGPTTIKMRFHELKDAPAGLTYVVWAVSPDNKYSRIGQIVNPGTRNEAEIKTETPLQDFGLFITTEKNGEAATPEGEIIGTIER